MLEPESKKWKYSEQGWQLKFLMDLLCILVFFLVLKTSTNRPEKWRDVWLYSAIFPLVNLLGRQPWRQKS